MTTYHIEADKTLVYNTLNGTQGPAGRAATIEVGTVTTGEPGSQVIIENVGTESEAVLNFTIPQGQTGATGPTGPTGQTGPAGAQGPAGSDGVSATIAVGNVTTGQPGSSVTITNTGTSRDAIFDFSIPQGATGAAGADGADGQAATISVGTVTTGTPSTPASVTNSGTSSQAVFDFVIPQGQTGATGPTGPGVAAGGTAGQILAKIDGTDYNTEWITVSSGETPNPYKENGSKVVINLESDGSYDARSIKIVLKRGNNQMLDWGDGSDPIQTASNVTYAHTYESLGYHELTIYKKETGDFWHDVSISNLYSYDAQNPSSSVINRAYIVSAKASFYCSEWNLYIFKPLKFEGSDLSEWYSKAFEGNRVLGTFGAVYTLEGEVKLPQVGYYQCNFDYAGYMTSLVIPDSANIQQWKNLFAPNGQSSNFSRLRRIIIEKPTPPIIDGTLWLPNVPIIVPWSADHSILNAYKLANGFSSYSSQIVEADAPINNGIPEGGTQGQVLSKIDGTDYNVGWTTPSGGSEPHDVELTISVTAGQTITFRGVASSLSWGDGTDLSPATRGSTHTYTEAGSYKVLIDGITEWGDSSQSGVARSILGANIITSAVFNVTEIGNQAFRECTSLTSITSLKPVSSFGKSAFYNCTGLTGDINSLFPTWNIQRIDSYAFYGTELTGVMDLSHFVSKSSDAYDYSTSAIPNKITRVILPQADITPRVEFESQSVLEDVFIPDGVRVLNTISLTASNNSHLYHVRIPGSVQTLQGRVFYNCKYMKTLYIEDGAFSEFPTWERRDNTESYTWSNTPTNVSLIAGILCSNCSSLEKIRLPEGMRCLGSTTGYATYIDSTFYNSKISELKLPSTLEKIYNVCQECNYLTTMTFPASLTEIKQNSFMNCANLNEVHMLGTVPPSVTTSGYPFKGTPIASGNGVIYVPYSADHSVLAAYQAADGWSNFATVMVEEPTP